MSAHAQRYATYSMVITEEMIDTAMIDVVRQGVATSRKKVEKSLIDNDLLQLGKGELRIEWRVPVSDA